MAGKLCATIQIDIESDRDVVWGLLTDYDRWAGLFPHVRQIEVLDACRNRAHIRTVERRTALITISVESTVRSDPVEKRYWRLYRGRVLERWTVDASTPTRTRLRCDIFAGSTAGRLRSRFMTAPLAWKTARMVALLAEAETLARSSPRNR